MAQSYVGLADAQARLYYSDLVSWVRDLHGAHEVLVLAMTSLLEEYDQVVPRCKLRLYPRKRPDSFGPTALYWGILFRLHPSSSGRGRKLPAKAIHHLKGPFDPAWIFTIAKRFDLKDRFLDFDRRRLALNGACRAVYRALRVVRKASVLKVPPGSSPIFVPSGLVLGSHREVPGLSEDLPRRELPPRLREVLRAGWALSFSLGVCEEEFCELGTEVQGNPSLDGIKLTLERARGVYYRQASWIHASTGKSYPKMTDRLMRALRVKQGARPVLALKELKRRRIASLQAEAGKTIRAIREACSKAQVEVATGLAQAKGFLLPGAGSLPSPRAAI